MIAEIGTLTLWPAERVIPVDRIASLLRAKGGATMTQLVAKLGIRRDQLSNDLETMRDYLGYPIVWSPAFGTYRMVAARTGSRRRTGEPDLALLERAIALEEFAYISFAVAPDAVKCLHALPRRARKKNGKAQVKLVERSGAWRVIDVESIREVQEAFGMNK